MQLNYLHLLRLYHHAMCVPHASVLGSAYISWHRAANCSRCPLTIHAHPLPHRLCPQVRGPDSLWHVASVSSIDAAGEQVDVQLRPALLSSVADFAAAAVLYITTQTLPGMPELVPCVPGAALLANPVLLPTYMPVVGAEQAVVWAAQLPAPPDTAQACAWLPGNWHIVPQARWMSARMAALCAWPGQVSIDPACSAAGPAIAAQVAQSLPLQASSTAAPDAGVISPSTVQAAALTPRSTLVPLQPPPTATPVASPCTALHTDGQAFTAHTLDAGGCASLPSQRARVPPPAGCVPGVTVQGSAGRLRCDDWRLQNGKACYPGPAPPCSSYTPQAGSHYLVPHRHSLHAGQCRRVDTMAASTRLQPMCALSGAAGGLTPATALVACAGCGLSVSQAAFAASMQGAAAKVLAAAAAGSVVASQASHGEVVCIPGSCHAAVQYVQACTEASQLVPLPQFPTGALIVALPQREVVFASQPSAVSLDELWQYLVLPHVPAQATALAVITDWLCPSCVACDCCGSAGLQLQTPQQHGHAALSAPLLYYAGMHHVRWRPKQPLVPLGSYKARGAAVTAPGHKRPRHSAATVAADQRADSEGLAGAWSALAPRIADVAGVPPSQPRLAGDECERWLFAEPAELASRWLLCCDRCTKLAAPSNFTRQCCTTGVTLDAGAVTLLCSTCNGKALARYDDLSSNDVASISAGRHPLWGGLYMCRACRRSVPRLLWRIITEDDRQRLFWMPVTEESAPGYLHVIQYPCDLSSLAQYMKTGLFSGKPADLQLMRDMLHLIVLNALMFNEPQSPAARASKRFLVSVGNQFRAVLPWADATGFQAELLKHSADIKATLTKLAKRPASSQRVPLPSWPARHKRIVSLLQHSNPYFLSDTADAPRPAESPSAVMHDAGTLGSAEDARLGLPQQYRVLRRAPPPRPYSNVPVAVLTLPGPGAAAAMAGVDLCRVCGSSGDCDDMLLCVDCGEAHHAYCTHASSQITGPAVQRAWRCPNCQVCAITGDAAPSDDQALLYCDSCDAAFLSPCLNPPLASPPAGKWLCGACVSASSGLLPKPRSWHVLAPEQTEFTPLLLAMLGADLRAMELLPQVATEAAALSYKPRSVARVRAAFVQLQRALLHTARAQVGLAVVEGRHAAIAPEQVRAEVQLGPGAGMLSATFQDVRARCADTCAELPADCTSCSICTLATTTPDTALAGHPRCQLCARASGGMATGLSLATAYAAECAAAQKRLVEAVATLQQECVQCAGRGAGPVQQASAREAWRLLTAARERADRASRTAIQAASAWEVSWPSGTCAGVGRAAPAAAAWLQPVRKSAGRLRSPGPPSLTQFAAAASAAVPPLPVPLHGWAAAPDLPADMADQLHAALQPWQVASQRIDRLRALPGASAVSFSNTAATVVAAAGHLDLVQCCTDIALGTRSIVLREAAEAAEETPAAPSDPGAAALCAPSNLLHVLLQRTEKESKRRGRAKSATGPGYSTHLPGSHSRARALDTAFVKQYGSSLITVAHQLVAARVMSLDASSPLAAQPEWARSLLHQLAPYCDLALPPCMPGAYSVNAAAQWGVASCEFPLLPFESSWQPMWNAVGQAPDERNNCPEFNTDPRVCVLTSACGDGAEPYVFPFGLALRMCAVASQHVGAAAAAVPQLAGTDIPDMSVAGAGTRATLMAALPGQVACSDDIELNHLALPYCAWQLLAGIGGRLLPLPHTGAWASLMALLWAYEVVPSDGAELLYVQHALRRGSSARCVLCGRTGATTLCCVPGCGVPYHLHCAVAAGCTFHAGSKAMFCCAPACAPEVMPPLPPMELLPPAVAASITPGAYAVLNALPLDRHAVRMRAADVPGLEQQQQQQQPADAGTSVLVPVGLLRAWHACISVWSLPVKARITVGSMQLEGEDSVDGALPPHVTVTQTPVSLRQFEPDITGPAYIVPPRGAALALAHINSQLRAGEHEQLPAGSWAAFLREWIGQARLEALHRAASTGPAGAQLQESHALAAWYHWQAASADRGAALESGHSLVQNNSLAMRLSNEGLAGRLLSFGLYQDMLGAIVDEGSAEPGERAPQPSDTCVRHVLHRACTLTSPPRLSGMPGIWLGKGSFYHFLVSSKEDGAATGVPADTLAQDAPCLTRVGALTVVRWGRIASQYLQAHTRHALFPVGYRARRVYWAPGPVPFRRCVYLLSIDLDEQAAGLQFRIQCDAAPELDISAAAPDDALLQLRARLARPHHAAQLGCATASRRSPLLQPHATGGGMPHLHGPTWRAWVAAQEAEWGCSPLRVACQFGHFAPAPRARWGAAAGLTGADFFGVGLPSIARVLETMRDAESAMIVPAAHTHANVRGVPEPWARYEFRWHQPVRSKAAMARIVRDAAAAAERPNLSGAARAEPEVAALGKAADQLQPLAPRSVPGTTVQLVPGPVVQLSDDQHAYLARAQLLRRAGVLAARMDNLDRVPLGDGVMAPFACMDTELSGTGPLLCQADRATNAEQPSGSPATHPAGSPAASPPCASLAGSASGSVAPGSTSGAGAGAAAGGRARSRRRSARGVEASAGKRAGTPAVTGAADAAAGTGAMQGDAVDGGAAPDAVEGQSSARQVEITSAWRAFCSAPVSTRLCVRRSPIHGWGLFARVDLPRDCVICEYNGVRFRQASADAVEADYNARGMDGACYLFRMDDDNIVDATFDGGPARFINHCCEPNAYSKTSTVGSGRRILIMAATDISRGEEITYDYKFPSESEALPCYCGAPGCRGRLN